MERKGERHTIPEAEKAAHTRALRQASLVVLPSRSNKRAAKVGFTAIDEDASTERWNVSGVRRQSREGEEEGRCRECKGTSEGRRRAGHAHVKSSPAGSQRAQIYQQHPHLRARDALAKGAERSEPSSCGPTSVERRGDEVCGCVHCARLWMTAHGHGNPASLADDGTGEA